MVSTVQMKLLRNSESKGWIRLTYAGKVMLRAENI